MKKLFLYAFVGTLLLPFNAAALECSAKDVDRAKALYSESKFQQAAELLECISEKTDQPKYLFNAGHAWLGAKYLAHAVQALTKYLNSSHTKYTGKAKALLAQTKASCGKVTITVPDGPKTLTIQRNERPTLVVTINKKTSTISLDEGQWSLLVGSEKKDVTIKVSQVQTITFTNVPETQPETKPEPQTPQMTEATIAAWSIVGLSGAALSTGLSLVLVGDRGMRDVDHGLRPTGENYRDEMLPELNLRGAGYITLGTSLGLGMTGGTHFLIKSQRSIAWWTELGIGAALAISGISWAGILEGRKDGKSFSERWQDDTYFNQYIGAQTLIGVGTGLMAGATTMLIMDELSARKKSALIVLPAMNSVTFAATF